jgi:hypothetical protein
MTEYLPVEVYLLVVVGDMAETERVFLIGGREMGNTFFSPTRKAYG